MGERAKQNAFYTGMAAAIMLLFGFGMGGMVSTVDLGPFYESTINAFNWMLKIGGLGLAVVAIVCWFGFPLGLLLDYFVSLSCGVFMTACAIFWTIREKSVDIQTILVVVFGVAFVRNAFVSFAIYRRPSAEGGGFPVQEVAEPENKPIHPASIRPSSLPEDGEPPEGYLAALSKEKDEPPTGSYK